MGNNPNGKADTTKKQQNTVRPDLNSLRNEVSGGLDEQPELQLDNKKNEVKKGDTLTTLERKVFGYNIFHNANVNFTPNLNMPTPKNYVVGPGDVLLLQVYGVAQSSYSLTVSPEGKVNLPDIGIAKVGGFSIEAVKSILLNKLALRYSGITGTSPNTFLEVTLSNIRTIKVNMVGEIYKPGTYSLPSYINLFTALFAAGGPTVKGTFRYVQVYRAAKLVAEIDIYDFLVNGKTGNNIRLEDEDVILVRPATNRVEITGEVRTQGIFELKANESFNDLLKFSGGFTENAFKEMINVTRKGLIEKQIFDLYSDQFQKAKLNDGDSLSVGVILDRFTNRVQISGAVNRPGPFALSNGMTIQDLIEKAGGVKGDAFLKRIILYRTKADFTQQVLSFDMSSEDGRSRIKKALLEREDVVSISNLYDLQEEYYVEVTGEVNKAGVFPFAEGLTVGDLILKADGFKYSASGSFIEIVRRVTDPGKVADILTVSIDKSLQISEENSKTILKPFDQIFVRTTPGYQKTKLVTIGGEVLLNGTFAIDKKEMRISDLLARAGGLTSYAYAKGATLVRRTNKFNAQTSAEEEREKLISLKTNLNKDELIAVSEGNKELSKRVNEKLKSNKTTINKEQEVKNKELQKQILIKENATTIQSSNSASMDEKEQELVAIDLEEIIKKPGSSADLVLKDGDLLNVPEKLETVSIKGGVLYPVSVRFEPGISFKEYINRAGGFSTRAIKNKSYVLQANGRVQRVKTVLFFKSYPKVEPGAEIFVPATITDKPPFNYGNTIGAITGIITSALTIIFLLRTL